MLYFLRGGARRAAELAVESSIRKPSITSLINTLEGKGWISRKEDPDDRRALSIKITPEGAEAMKRFEHDLDEVLIDFLGQEAAKDAEEEIGPLFDIWNDRRKQGYKDWLQRVDHKTG